MINQSKVLKIKFVSFILILTGFVHVHASVSQTESFFLQEYNPNGLTSPGRLADLDFGDQVDFDMYIEIVAFPPAGDSGNSHQILKFQTEETVPEGVMISLSTSATAVHKFVVRFSVGIATQYDINTDETHIPLEQGGIYHLEIAVSETDITVDVTDVSTPANAYHEEKSTAHNQHENVPIYGSAATSAGVESANVIVTDLFITSSIVHESDTGESITLWDLPPTIQKEKSIEIPEFRPDQLPAGTALMYMDIGDAMRFQMDIEIQDLPPDKASYVILQSSETITDVVLKIFLRPVDADQDKYTVGVQLSIDGDANPYKVDPVLSSGYPLETDGTYQLKVDLTQNLMTVNMVDIHYETDTFMKETSISAHQTPSRVPIYGRELREDSTDYIPAAEVTVHNLIVESHTFFKASQAKSLYKKDFTPVQGKLYTHMDVGDIMHFKFDITIEDSTGTGSWMDFLHWGTSSNPKLAFELNPADDEEYRIRLIIPNTNRVKHKYYLKYDRGYDLGGQYHLEIDITQAKIKWSVQQMKSFSKSPFVPQADSTLGQLDIGDHMDFDMKIEITSFPPADASYDILQFQTETGIPVGIVISLSTNANGADHNFVIRFSVDDNGTPTQYDIMTDVGQLSLAAGGIYRLVIDISETDITVDVTDASNPENTYHDEKLATHTTHENVPIYGCGASSSGAADVTVMDLSIISLMLQRSEGHKHHHLTSENENIYGWVGPSPPGVDFVTLSNLYLTSEIIPSTSTGSGRIYADFDRDAHDEEDDHHHGVSHMGKANDVADVESVFQSHGLLPLYIVIAVGAALLFVAVVLRKYRSRNASKTQQEAACPVDQNAVEDFSVEDLENYAPESNRDLESGMMDDARSKEEIEPFVGLS